MGNLVGKIVLTGGPCAGKTTALSRIEEYLTERGYRVFIVSESATEMIKGGIRPFGDNAFDMIKFQDLILKYQISKEEIYDDAIKYLSDDEKCVIIYDRGLMDNKAYITDQQFSNLLKKMNLNEIDLLDRYDMVIHLVTAADGCSQYYTLENNEARSESIEEAIELDRKTLNTWIGHNNLVVIDNSTNFEEKINRVIDNIKEVVKFPYSTKYQRKYKVDLNNSSLDFLDDKGVTKIDITQTYLGSIENNEGYEKRLRKRNLNGEDSYYFTVKKNDELGVNKIITDKKIKESDYIDLLNLHDNRYEIKKTRYTFVYKKQYFTLDIFENGDAILEINQTSAKKNVNLPPDLSVEEVTGIEKYNNYNIAYYNSEKQKIKDYKKDSKTIDKVQ